MYVYETTPPHEDGMSKGLDPKHQSLSMGSTKIYIRSIIYLLECNNKTKAFSRSTRIIYTKGSVSVFEL